MKKEKKKFWTQKFLALGKKTYGRVNMPPTTPVIIVFIRAHSLIFVNIRFIRSIRYSLNDYYSLLFVQLFVQRIVFVQLFVQRIVGIRYSLVFGIR